MSRLEGPRATLPRPLRVALRVDASDRIGAGHVMRCLTLARTLRSAGHAVTFLSREAPGDLHSFLEEEHGFAVTKLQPAGDNAPVDAFERSDASATVEALDGQHVDWIVVDHYRLGATWEAKVRSATRRVLAIDDFASRSHASDAILDHNLVPTSVYSGTDTLGVRLLLGPSYALVRPELTSPPGREKIADWPQNVLVSFGGSDSSGQTLRIVNTLRSIQPAPKRIVVMAGRLNPDHGAIMEMAEEWTALEVHGFVTRPELLLESADLAIGAGGVSALERAAMGVPSIVLATAGNQIGPSRALASTGAILYLGEATDVDDPTLAAAIQTMANPHLRESMRMRGRALVDGKGPQHIVREMQKCMPVQVRLATVDDRARIFEWRNHKDVRRTAFDPSEISWSAHQCWFESVLADPDRHLLVSEQSGTAFGVVRYDLKRLAGTAEISIFLAPDVHGLGLGGLVLRAADAWLAEREPSIARVEAKVLGANDRSHRVFISSGFRVRETTLELMRNTLATADEQELNTLEAPREDA